ncbi:hypothetical protein Goklo_005720, partial [Gossypium klotzschianum]|nr:hypothetical protein [Gossypium klotzschianum]
RCTSFEAELLDILDDILFLLSKGFKRGTVQTDSLEVVRALQENGREDSGITMFR